MGTGSGVIDFPWGVQKWGPLRWAQKDKCMKAVLRGGAVMSVA